MTGGRPFTCNVSKLWCVTCDAQGRVKKIRPVKWTEGGEDRSQVLPFDILPCFLAAPFSSIPAKCFFCLILSCESSTKSVPLGHVFVPAGSRQRCAYQGEFKCAACRCLAPRLRCCHCSQQPPAPSLTCLCSWPFRCSCKNIRVSDSSARECKVHSRASQISERRTNEAR